MGGRTLKNKFSVGDRAKDPIYGTKGTVKAVRGHLVTVQWDNGQTWDALFDYLHKSKS